MFCLISSKEIISLGIKPVRGGRPAKESNVSIEIATNIGVFAHKMEMSSNFIACVEVSKRNIAVVIIIYKIKLNSVKEGSNFKTNIIQPRWPIDENARIFRICV